MNWVSWKWLWLLYEMVGGLWLLFSFLFIVEIHYIFLPNWLSSGLQALQFGSYKVAATLMRAL
jgi:hypothetical protein